MRNGVDTLPAAVASIRSQTEESWELVLVNDGSDDGTAEWIDAHLAQDARITILHTPPRGLVHALNEGLKRCRAPWIARMDADDLAMPDRLEAQLAALTADHTLAVVDGQVRFFRDGEAVPDGMHLYGDWINRVLTPEDFDRELLVESPVVHPGATLRKQAVLEVGGYRDGPFPEDYDLWLRLHAAGWRLQKVPQVVVHMRDRPQRLTRTDSRYGRAGFVRVRQDWLDATILRRPRRVVLWGAGKQGRPWLRWLLERGHEVPAVIDIDPKKIGNVRQGRVPIVEPERLRTLEADLMLVAVGARGARAAIREAVGSLRPSWTEGKDWWCLK